MLYQYRIAKFLFPKKNMNIMLSLIPGSVFLRSINIPGSEVSHCLKLSLA